VGDLVVGVLGLFPGGGLLGSLIVATIAAVLLLFLVRLIKRA
jgi:uncharacterized membrane protein YeaQ/YmgE (transglycosylase-associated protein family)